MKPRYRLIVRSARGGTFYCVDTVTKKRTSLQTADRYEAGRILHAKNEAAIQPMLNLQIARAYLFGADEAIGKRTWRDAIIAVTETKLGSNKERWQRAQKEKAFAPLWVRPLVETKGEELLAVMRRGGASTNIDEILELSFGVVMANGLETFITLAADGSIRGYQPFPDDAVSTKVLSPLRFARLSGWTIDGRVGLALTRNGEILVFSGKSLRFARRRGIWHYFAHDAVIDRMRLNRAVDALVAKAAYETCLDVSFARTGGGIGILRPDKVNAVLTGSTISEDDRVGADSAKGRFLEAIIGGAKFQDLDRRLRQDLVAIDGATVLDPTGRILAVGAIWMPRFALWLLVQWQLTMQRRAAISRKGLSWRLVTIDRGPRDSFSRAKTKLGGRN